MMTVITMDKEFRGNAYIIKERVPKLEESDK